MSGADDERRFGALRRLYGDQGYERLRASRVAVVGLGGVGSWAVEALARSGVAEIVLIDLDHVAESNINRQIQALSPTLGLAKGVALAERIAHIHPGCRVHVVDDFVTPSNWPALWPGVLDGLIDACDQVQAKHALAAWALTSPQRCAFVTVGAAGGKLSPEAVEVDDLQAVTHDPLLASLRHRLRRSGHARRVASRTTARAQRIGVDCVFSREAVVHPPREGTCEPGAPLACHGYGSSVAVTATFGMTAAGLLIRRAVGSSR